MLSKRFKLKEIILKIDIQSIHRSKSDNKNMIKNIDGKQIAMKQKKIHQNTLICHVLLCLSFGFHLHIGFSTPPKR